MFIFLAEILKLTELRRIFFCEFSRLELSKAFGDIYVITVKYFSVN